MLIDDKILLETLEDMNELYKKQGNKMFSQMRKRLLSIGDNSIIEHKNEILALLHQHIEEPDPLIAKRLLSTFCHQTETPNMEVNPDLAKWFSKSMKTVLQGEDFKSVFGLKRTKRGRPDNTYSVSELRIAAAHEYYCRKGYKPTEAKELVQKNIGCEERTINRAIKALKIAPHIETGLLEELMKYDYDNAFGYRH